MKLTENHIEEAALEWLEELGFEVVHGSVIAPEGSAPERESYGDVILRERLLKALAELNPQIAHSVFDDVVRKIEQSETPSLIEENRRLHTLMTNGVDLEVMRDDGTLSGETVKLIDFENIAANNFLAVNQFTVIENGHDRRPDIVLFVNGLPLAVIELKNAGDENATIDKAYSQIQTYKEQIPSLFRTNGLLVTSDGLEARVGALTATKDRFMPWRTVDGVNVAKKGLPEMEVLIKGLFFKNHFLDLISGFTVFEDDGTKIIKKIAGYHP